MSITNDSYRLCTEKVFVEKSMWKNLKLSFYVIDNKLRSNKKKYDSFIENNVSFVTMTKIEVNWADITNMYCHACLIYTKI